MFCSKCGAKLGESASFCSNCGTKVTDTRIEEIVTDDPRVFSTRNDVKIPHDYAWWLIIIPGAMWFLGVFLRMDIARIGNVVLFIVMCWLAYKDSQLFEKAGLPKPIPAWIVFPPVYFYKRGKIQGQTMKLFKRSLGTFAVICAVIIFPEFFADFQPLEKRITAAAPQAVNQIAAERFPNASKCTKVTLNGQVSDNKYKGTAFLDNGNTVEVDISLNGDSIYVEIPMSQFLKF